jgi:glyceraldehyde 3-phosphate dehydrogenase
MPTKIAINGFGRIGRMVLRALAENPRADFEIIAINDLADAPSLAHLLKYDSVHGRFPASVDTQPGKILVDGKPIACFSERDPADLPWEKLGIDIVMECTGFFLTQELCQKHIDAGAKRVLMSAPAKDDSKTIVYGVNHALIDASDLVISNASCTTNALAPVLSVLDEHFGVLGGIMTTVHAYTGDQMLHDGLHKNPVRGRAGAMSMIPTTTGAAKAIGKVIPKLDGKLDGTAVRVPVPNVSMVDLTLNTEAKVDVDSVNSAFLKASKTNLKGVLGYVDEALVSSDFNHDPHSSCFVENQTIVNQDQLVRVLAWYDNEWGFSNRMLDTASVLAEYL